MAVSTLTPELARGPTARKSGAPPVMRGAAV
jgi:hypothetical protein